LLQSVAADAAADAQRSAGHHGDLARYLGVASAVAGICDESGARLSSFSMYHVVKAMYAPQMTTGK
jgi:hypothetical protein